MVVTGTPPSLTGEERQKALERALLIRRERAAIKERLNSGELSVRDVLDMEGEAAERMPTRHLISSLPGYGNAKADKVMREIGIASNRRLKGLGKKQRVALIERLDKGGLKGSGAENAESVTW